MTVVSILLIREWFGGPPFLTGVLQATVVVPVVIPALLAFFLVVAPRRAGRNLPSTVQGIALSGCFMAIPPRTLGFLPLAVLLFPVALLVAGYSVFLLVRWSWDVRDGGVAVRWQEMKPHVLFLLAPYFLLALGIGLTLLAPNEPIITV